MSRRTIQMTDTLHDYMLANSLREAPILARLRRETEEAVGSAAQMQISPEQGQFMALMVRLTGAREILEVGTFTGYSALCMASALPDDGHLIACDTSAEWTAIARRFWSEAGVAERIDLRLAPAADTLSDLRESERDSSFDLAFIDADKTNYMAYYEQSLALLRPGGLIMIDNVLWGGSVADEANTKDDTVALRALNAHVHGDQRVDSSLLPIGDGLTLARKR